MAGSISLKIITDEVSPARRRGKSRLIMVGGFQGQGNLGRGYLASKLRSHGYSVEVFDFEQPAEEILRAAKSLDPILIGFSLIFQFYVDRFGVLISYLRDHGVNCHFTMGGHFPRLSYEHTLQLVPELDCVVRLEAEMTLLELVDLVSV